MPFSDSIWIAIIVILILLILIREYRFRQSQIRRTRPLRLTPNHVERKITVDGRERSYVVYIPSSYNRRTFVPLVIVLHGGGGHAQNAIRVTGMSHKAEQEGFIVAYPNGTSRVKNGLLTWNAGNCCGFALNRSIDDVAFIRAMIEQLHTEFKINPQRVYATGISNGGMMAYRLACELADKLAAIASVSGALNFEPCQPSVPVSVIIFHGTADQHVLYEGGKPTKRLDNHERVDKSVTDAVSFWVSYNGCTGGPEKQQQGNILRTSYTQGCKDHTAVVLYTIVDGGHAWPGGQKGRSIGDEPTQEIFATDLMWEFFQQHPKPHRRQ